MNAEDQEIQRRASVVPERRVITIDVGGKTLAEQIEGYRRWKEALAWSLKFQAKSVVRA